MSDPVGENGNGWTAAGAGPSTASEPTYSSVQIISTAAVPVVETADEVAALVRAVPGVVDLHAGRFGEVATYLPGRRVTGVKLAEDRAEVHVVLEFDAPIRAVAQQIHGVLAAVLAVPVQVFVEDLAASRTA